MSHPACTRHDPQLFDSTHPFDHLRARRTCGTCPMVQDCIARALAIANTHQPACRNSHRGPDGTWGGLLWRDGRVVDLRLNLLEEAA